MMRDRHNDTTQRGIKQALALDLFGLASAGTWAADVQVDGLVPGLDIVFACRPELQDLWSVAKMGMWDDPPRDGREGEGHESIQLNREFTHDEAGHRKRRERVMKYVKEHQSLILALTLPRLYVSNYTPSNDPCRYELSNKDVHVRAKESFRPRDCIQMLPSHGLHGYMGKDASQYRGGDQPLV